MKILALETSAKAVSAAITENGVVLASGYQDTGLTHSRTLMPIVKHLFQNTGIAPQELDAIAVAVGPGSFTGIRIGVSAAKGLAYLGCYGPERSVCRRADPLRYGRPARPDLQCGLLR